MSLVPDDGDEGFVAWMAIALLVALLGNPDRLPERLAHAHTASGSRGASICVSADRLPTAIARACRAAGVPVFSPHDLRHRRISLLHRQGRTWAEIGRFVGQRKLSVTADTYTHVLTDGREVGYATLLG